MPELSLCTWETTTTKLSVPSIANLCCGYFWNNKGGVEQQYIQLDDHRPAAVQEESDSRHKGVQIPSALPALPSRVRSHPHVPQNCRLHPFRLNSSLREVSQHQGSPYLPPKLTTPLTAQKDEQRLQTMLLTDLIWLGKRCEERQLFKDGVRKGKRPLRGQGNQEKTSSVDLQVLEGQADLVS